MHDPLVAQATGEATARTKFEQPGFEAMRQDNIGEGTRPVPPSSIENEVVGSTVGPPVRSVPESRNAVFADAYDYQPAGAGETPESLTNKFETL